MNKILHFVFFTFSAFLITSCGPKADPALQTLMDEVMEIHDEVMPKMGKIHTLKKKLKKHLSAEIENVSPARGKILGTIKTLEQADDGMMNWMAEYKKLSKLKEDTDPMEYYNAEKGKIQQVSDAMYQAIEDAEVLLSKLNANE